MPPAEFPPPMSGRGRFRIRAKVRHACLTRLLRDAAVVSKMEHTEPSATRTSPLRSSVAGSRAVWRSEVVVRYRPRIALDSAIFQKAAQPVEEAVFVGIVQEYSLPVDSACDHVLQGAGCVNS